MIKLLGITGTGLIVALALSATVAGARGVECLATDGAFGKYETAACNATLPGTAYILATLIAERNLGLYCAKVFVPETGRFLTLQDCLNGVNEQAKGLYLWVKADPGLLAVSVLFLSGEGPTVLIKNEASQAIDSELQSEVAKITAKKFTLTTTVLQEGGAPKVYTSQSSLNRKKPAQNARRAVRRRVK